MLDVEDRRDALAGEGEREDSLAALGDRDRGSELWLAGVDVLGLALLKGSDFARMRPRAPEQ